MHRSLLLWLLAGMGFIPVGTGLVSILLGPDLSPGGEALNASLDSEYRFLSVVWLSVGVILWWSLLEPARRAAVTRTILVVCALGGLGRILPAVEQGLPHPVFVMAWVLELAVLPFVIWWHARAYPVPTPTRATA